MRIQPRPRLAWAIGIGYAILFLVLEKIMGVGYDEIGTTTDSIVKGIVVPLVVGSIILIIVTTWLGWWRPVLRELPTDPVRPPRWLLAVPILVFIAVLLGIDYGNLGNMGGAMILWLALGTALVGFSEEITYRGLALVGFRGAYSEVKVWFFTSLLFGLLHGVNLILGQGAVPTIRQVVFAFVLGSVFYAIRRISGTIVVVMVLHALWDFRVLQPRGRQGRGCGGRGRHRHRGSRPSAVAARADRGHPRDRRREEDPQADGDRAGARRPSVAHHPRRPCGQGLQGLGPQPRRGPLRRLRGASHGIGGEPAGRRGCLGWLPDATQGVHPLLRSPGC